MAQRQERNKQGWRRGRQRDGSSASASKKAGVMVLALAGAFVVPVDASGSSNPHFRTSEDAFLTVDAALSRGAWVRPILSSGDTIGDFTFEGLPDGIGVRPGRRNGLIDVYVAHEQTTIPFRDNQDFQNSSISRVTLGTWGKQRARVMDAAVAMEPGEFLRFCSANMATPAEGMDDYVFFTGEETSDTVDGVQRGFAVALNTETGHSTAIPGMGRLNHENTVVVPGGWDELALLTTDDTFSAGTSQLYMYLADDQDAIFADTGSLYGLRVTGSNGKALADPADAFNGANDYLDLDVGESFQGQFIPVPRYVAIGDQDALEDWSNANNVFQFIRLEDVAYDPRNPLVVYIADTGASRVNPDPETGRMARPADTEGLADNGRVFKMMMNPDDPTIVDSLSILADGDAVDSDVYVPFRHPDNLDTSRKSLMVQEDASEAQIWQYHFSKDSWRSVASVVDPSGESTGIVDVSEWFGGGTWLVNVQGHGANVDVDTTSIPGTTIKRESGQLLLMRIPGS